jgi:hypothetical protein
MTVDAEGTAVFPLLCPVREYDWIDVWSCDVIYSESGIAELGCVFLTDLPGRGTETWVVTRFEPEFVIEFAARRVLAGPASCRWRCRPEPRVARRSTSRAAAR